MAVVDTATGAVAARDAVGVASGAASGMVLRVVVAAAAATVEEAAAAGAVVPSLMKVLLAVDGEVGAMLNLPSSSAAGEGLMTCQVSPTPFSSFSPRLRYFHLLGTQCLHHLRFHVSVLEDGPCSCPRWLLQSTFPQDLFLPLT